MLKKMINKKPLIVIAFNYEFSRMLLGDPLWHSKTL